MATVTISLSNSLVVNGSKNYTISDADVQTLVDYLTASSSIPGITPQQALASWAQRFVDQTSQLVQGYQKGQVSVPPIIFT